MLLQNWVTNQMLIISDRIRIAVSTFPNAQSWLYAAELLLIFTIIALPLGFWLKFLQVERIKISWQTTIGIIAASLLTPALTEEIFFRVLFLPQSPDTIAVTGLWLWGCISLVLFIVYHPLNALSFFSRGRKTFFDIAFLLLAALLGIICSLAYIQSGSLWTPVVIHWLVVVVWLLLFGGYSKLYS